MPTQERSKRRVTAILDAAAFVIAELGFEAATMEGIAERAETSIGSVYQFFPNKLTVFQSLAERCVERARAAFDRLASTEAQRLSWSELLDVAIDGFAALHDSDPGFRAVLSNFQLYGVYEEADTALHRHFAEQVETWVGAYAIELTRAQRKLVANTTVHIISAMLFLSRREEPSARKKMLDETKVVLRRYLEPYTRVYRRR